jgi:hypothetical protein
MTKKFWMLSAPLYSHSDWGGYLKTAQVLQAQGHTVLWISGESLRNAIQAHGIAFQAIRETGWLWPPPPAPDLTTISPQEAVMLRYRRALDTWLSEEIVGEATRAILELAEQIGPPDVIVTDPFLTAAALAAEKLGVKLAVCGWTAQRELDAGLLYPVQKVLATDSRDRLDRLLVHFGIHGENFSEGAAPSILSPHLHIAYFTREWYAADTLNLLDQNVFAGGLPTPIHTPAPEWLTAIREDVPLALITLGTTFTGDLGFFSWAAQAAARAGYLPIVVIGWNPITPQDKAQLIAALPKGARLLNFVPFEHVLPRIKLIYHHGGVGTTHAAVVYGIPQIVVPHAADQRVQARRVAQAKVGLNLTAHDVRQGMLWQATQALGKEERVREIARALADQMRLLGGPPRAAEALLTI